MLSFKELCRTWGIGLTGGIATGKSTIGRILKEKGYLVIDADQLSRLVVEPGTEGLAAVIQTFGPQFLTAEGTLDRTLMRTHIFSQPEARQALEAIIHPRLEAATARQLEDAQIFTQPRLWFYEASLLVERGRTDDFRSLWSSLCPESLQIQRVMARDQCSEDAARAILKAQMPAKEKAARAKLCIDTDCTLEVLHQRVEQALATEIARPPVPSQGQ